MKTRRGWLLVETLFMVALLAAAFALLGKLLVDGLYLQRIAAQRVDRRAGMDSFLRQLRADARSARLSRWFATRWELELHDVSASAGDGQSAQLGQAVYRIETDGFTREWNGVQSHSWRSERLQAVAWLESGLRGDVLWVAMRDLPPSRAVDLRLQTFVTAVPLPPAVIGPSDGPAEEEP